MPGPWEKFQAAPSQNAPALPAAPSGPWEKFQAPAEQTTAESPSTLKTIAKAAIGDFSDIPGVPEALKTPTSRAKAALGFAEGVGEVMNPVSIPHNLEVMGRASFQESSDPNKGFFENIIQRMGNAEKNSVIPKGDVTQIAAGVRTLGALPFSNKSIKDIYQDELKSQDNYEKNFLPAGSKAAGEITAGVANIGLLAKDVANTIGIGASAKSLANQSAFNSLKATGKYSRQLSATGRSKVIGNTLLDEGIVTSGASWKDILSRVETKLDDYGEQVGHFSKMADKAMAGDSSIKPISVDDLSNQIIKEVVEPKLADPSTKAQGKAILNWVEDLRATHPEGMIGFQKAQQLKTSLGKLGKFNKTATNAEATTAEAFRETYGVFNRIHEEGISSALSKANQDGLVSARDIEGFKKIKNIHRDLKDAENFISDTVGRVENNRWGSPTDYLLGATGALASASHGHTNVETLATGLAAAVANHLARTHGNQVAASFLNSVSKTIKAPTTSVLPKIAGPIAEGTGLINSIQKVNE